MTKVIFVRHGQSMGNLRREFLGHTDLPLSPLGQEQAERLKEHLKNEKIDVIYSSDLLRAMGTATPIAKALGLEIHATPALREIYAGAWEGKNFDDLTANYTRSYETFRKNIGVARPDGGESTQEVGARVYAAVLELAKQHEGKTLLISTHATAICMFACRALGLSAEQSASLALPSNASVSRFVFDGEKFVMRVYSEDSFLADAKTQAPPLA